MSVSPDSRPDSSGMRAWVARHWLAYVDKLRRRSDAVAPFLEARASALVAAWTAVFLLASLAKTGLSPTPVHNLRDWLEMALPYLVVGLAPLSGFVVADRVSRGGREFDWPAFRLSFVGRWRPLTAPEAKASPLFGPGGFLASLLIGLLLNVVIRSFEFLMAVPAVNGHAPAWGLALFLLMAGELAVMSLLYAACFVLCLRSHPLFPRLLLLIWGFDLLLQLVIARQMGVVGNLPPEVAGALATVLTGNLHKVLISMVIWLPYLLLSERVNVTYRHRASC